MADVKFDVEPDSRHKCQNCGRVRRGSELLVIEDFEQRVAPGEACPSGACSCGAVCHRISSSPRRSKR
jgi:hypothetical protein